MHPLIGKRVLNVHRQSCDYTQEFRDAHKGTITEVIEGCNPLVRVHFDSRDYGALMCPQDLAYVDIWPKEGGRVQL